MALPARAATEVAAAHAGTTSASRLPLATVLPVDTWWAERRAIRSRLGLFAAFAAMPFALLRLTADDAGITTAAWGFAIYFGAVWALAMHALIRPERLPWGLVARIVIFTAVAGALLAVSVSSWLGAGGDGFVEMTLTVGLPEEASKALAVYLFLFLSRRQWTPRAYLFAGVLSGLAFGITEAALYAELYDDITATFGTSTTTVSIWRLLSGGAFHAMLAAVPAYFIGLAYWHRRAVWPLLGVGLATASVLHGAYNAGSTSWFGTAVAVVVVLVFVGYVSSADRIALSLAAEPGPFQESPS